MNDKIKNLLIGTVSGGIAGWLAAKSNSTPTPTLAAGNNITLTPVTVFSDWIERTQYRSLDYWSVDNLYIPDNSIISNMYAEFTDAAGNTVDSVACWIVYNPYGGLAVGVFVLEPPITLRMRIVVKCYILE